MTEKTLISWICGVAIATVLVLIPGCGSSADHAARVEANKQQIEEALKHPEVIGTLPDGQVLQKVVIPQIEGWEHQVYFVGSVTSTNVTRSSGKSTHNEVTVNINGRDMPLNQAVIELNAAEVKYHEQELARLRAQPKGN